MEPMRPTRGFILGLLLILLPAGPGSAFADSAPAAATAAAPAAAASPDTAAAPKPWFETVLGDSTLATATLDTTVVRFRGMTLARQIVGEKGVWAVDYTWLTIRERPGMLFTLAQMESLEAAGVLGVDTIVTPIAWRTRVHALNKEFLRGIIDVYRPKAPPPELEAAAREAAARDAAAREATKSAEGK